FDPVIGSSGPSGSGTTGTGTSGTSTSGSSTSGSGSSTPAPTPPAAPKIASFSTDTGVVGDYITSDNTLTLTGSAVANSTVKVYEGTTLLGTTTAATDGGFSVTTPNLKHGSHTFTATATDAAGNTSALSQPIDPPIGSHGATGTSTVEVTNVRQHWDHTATIKGIADPNGQIKLSDGTTSAGSVTAGADGK